MIIIPPGSRSQVPYRVQRNIMLSNGREQRLDPRNPRQRTPDELARIQAATDKRLRKAAK